MANRPCDKEILELFAARDEKAIDLCARRYGKEIYAVCFGILRSREDAEECTNSVYYAAWTKIPGEDVRNLIAFLTKLARDISIDAYRKKTVAKRRGALESLPYEELSDLLFDDDVESQFDRKKLSDLLNDFLRDLTPDRRNLFIWRYYGEKSVSELTKLTGKSKPGVYFILNELKNELKAKLEKEGYTL